MRAASAPSARLTAESWLSRRYLDEFAIRWKRRRHMRSAFDTLFGIGVDLGPATYRDYVELRG